MCPVSERRCIYVLLFSYLKNMDIGLPTGVWQTRPRRTCALGKKQSRLKRQGQAFGDCQGLPLTWPWERDGGRAFTSKANKGPAFLRDTKGPSGLGGHREGGFPFFVTQQGSDPLYP